MRDLAEGSSVDPRGPGAAASPSTSTSPRSAPPRTSWCPPPTSRSPAPPRPSPRSTTSTSTARSCARPTRCKAVRAALEGRPPPCVGLLTALRTAVSPVLISRFEHTAGDDAEFVFRGGLRARAVTARPVPCASWSRCVAVAATWFVARPAFGSVDGRSTVARDRRSDGPCDLAADARRRGGHHQRAVGARCSTPAGACAGAVAVRRSRARPACARTPTSCWSAARRSVTALDACRRRRAVAPRPDRRRRTRVAVAGDTVLVGDDSGTLAALDAATGAPRWSVHHPARSGRARGSTRRRGAVVATWHQSDSPAVRVFDLATGALRWEAPTDRFTAAPAVHAGRVVLAIGDGDRHARVEARDLATGEVQWQTPVPASFEEAIEPAVDDRAVAVVDHFGVVTVLDPATGRLRWQHDLADVLVATRVVLTAAPGRVHVVRRGPARARPSRRPRGAAARVPPGSAGSRSRPRPSRRRGRGRRRAGLALRLHDWGVQLAHAWIDRRVPECILARKGRRVARYTRSPTRVTGRAVVARDPGSRTPAFRGRPGQPGRQRAEEQPRSSSHRARRPHAVGVATGACTNERTSRGRSNGRRHHEAAAGGRSPLRSPDPALEPQDEAVHLRGAQRDLHHRPAADPGAHRHRLPVRAPHRRERRHGALRRHEEAGPGADPEAGATAPTRPT